MKKYINLVLGIMLVVLFNSCKKEMLSPPVVPPNLPDTTIVKCDTAIAIGYYSSHTDTSVRVRLDNGKTFRILHGGGGYTEYTYEAGYVIEKGIGTDGTILSQETFYLNSQGYVNYRVGTGFMPEDSAYFQYDSDGYLISLTSYLNYGNEIATQTFSYTDGNLVAAVYTDHSGTWNIAYDYYLEKQNMETENQCIKGLAWGFSNWYLGMEGY